MESNDPIPVDLLKKYLDIFLPVRTKLVNISLLQGSMKCLKTAALLPLIKELDTFMDSDNLKNYRPVFNVVFIGKPIERVVGIRLNMHMTGNNLHCSFQYGYKKAHSAETLLLKVVNNIMAACDDQMPSTRVIIFKCCIWYSESNKTSLNTT